MRTNRSSRRTSIAPIAIAEVPLGVLAGAALGAFAGPAGLIAGALGGSFVGAVLAIGHNRQMRLDAIDEERVDRELGIIGGDIGAPNLRHPPATVGTFSSGSLGFGGRTDTEVAEGPMPPPVDPG